MSRPPSRDVIVTRVRAAHRRDQWLGRVDAESFHRLPGTLDLRAETFKRRSIKIKLDAQPVVSLQEGIGTGEESCVRPEHKR
ncbi:hypothetical protein VOM14_27840 [Paraburkholderia sp. MPAMCS5]|uniref:hypothetical protein n=1 Tax=Paraburkholderia sp. MPAMCS5 TaxID=3112563 RepID=UPI002E193E6D|nr:hypothetical protein [Paraburkholderia sp. MPAMCS5]